MDNTALHKLSYGLYVVGVKAETGFGGCIVDAVAQVSAETPPTLILSCMKKNYTNELIKLSGEFTISILPGDIDPFIVSNFGFQSARTAKKWENVPHTQIDGLPVLDAAIAYLRCKVTDLREFTTHSMFFFEPTDAENRSPKARPLIFGDYQADMKTAAAAAFTAFKKEQNN